MPLTAEEIRVLLSEHLLQDNLDSAVEEIREMQNGRGMIAADHEIPILQGDIFDRVPCVLRADGNVTIEPKRVLLVSNSCDATPDNPRPIPLDLTVAPLLRLSRYHQMLVDNGVDAGKADDAIRSIRRQEKTNIVYLPTGAGIQEEMVALLDKVQSLPYGEFIAAGAPRLAVLTTRGYWILLVKLAMHFSRPHEGVERQAA